MELEELKNSWNELSQQLAEKNIVEKNALIETIRGRVQSAFDKLLHGQIRSLVIDYIMALGLMPFLYMQHTYSLPSFIVIETVVVLGTIWASIMAYRLSKVDYSQSVAKMSERIMTYKRDLKLNTIVFAPLTIAAVIACYVIEGSGIMVYALFAATMVFAAIITIVFLRKKSNEIKAIEQDIEKLREYNE